MHHCFAARTDVAVAFFVPSEVGPQEGAVLAVTFVKDWDERQDLTFCGQPNQIVGATIRGISCNPIRFQAKALFGTLDHLAHGAHLGGSVRAAGIQSNDDTVINPIFSRICKASGAFAIRWSDESAASVVFAW
jgi:hypothetical protein